MSTLGNLARAHPRLCLAVAGVVIALLLVAIIDRGRKLTAAETEALLVGQAALLCLADGQPATEYFVLGGAYQLDWPGATGSFGRWHIEPEGAICIEVEGRASDCRYVMRQGASLLWMWVNPSRFASFTLGPDDPCEAGGG